MNVHQETEDCVLVSGFLFIVYSSNTKKARSGDLTLTGPVFHALEKQNGPFMILAVFRQYSD
jgi:hypothetical protein